MLSFNAAGIPLVHPELAARLDAAGAAIAALGPDAVGLQELWLDADHRRLAAGAGLPEAVRPAGRGPLGAGLSLLSRWPVVESALDTFTLKPSLLRLHQGEAAADKGVLYTLLRAPWGPVAVFNTHLIANYPADGAAYRAIRLAQVFELWESIERHAAGRPTVVLGDLNAAPDAEAARVLLDLTGLADVCRRDGAETCAPPGRARIDYVLAPRARRSSATAALTGGVPGRPGLELSDHPAVAAVLDESDLAAPPAPDPARRRAALAVVDGALSAMETGMRARLARRWWVPGYGALMRWRYQEQFRRISGLRRRVAAARALTP